MKKKYSIVFLLSFTVLLGQPPRTLNKDLKFVFEPDSLSLNIGEEASVLIRLVDSKGNQVKSTFVIRGQRKALDAKPRRSDSTGVAKVNIKAFDAGKLNLRAMAFGKSGRTVGTMKVNVPLPPLEKITFPADPLNAQIQIRLNLINGMEEFSINLIEMKTGEIKKNFYSLDGKETCVFNNKEYSCFLLKRYRESDKRITTYYLIPELDYMFYKVIDESPDEYQKLQLIELLSFG